MRLMVTHLSISPFLPLSMLCWAGARETQYLLIFFPNQLYAGPLSCLMIYDPYVFDQVVVGSTNFGGRNTSASGRHSAQPEYDHRSQALL